ncbi:MAG: condensation domain-containing protein, partial [Geminicoccaceae bacterium]
MPTSSLDLALLAERLPASPETVEDAYPLSPMQAGMLFHTVEDGEGGTGLYINQMSVDVAGLDTDRFASAWQAAVDRHAVLRTGFIWEGAADPFQFVLRHAELPVREIDWRHLAVTPAMLAELAAGEQTRGFDLKRPPLMRLLLVRLAGGRCRMIWTYHHVLIDGWSTSQLVGDVLRHYRGEASEPAGRYRDYIDWLQRQDAEATRQFWCRRLAALEEPTSLASAMPPGARGQGHAAIYTRWSQERTAPLVAFAQRQRITINTLVQGAWLLLLRRCTGQRTVAFGATVSGRPADLAGAGSMLGLFINTLPVIQTPHPAQPVGDWLRVLQEDNLALREHEHAPLQDINRWAGQPGRGLFDSIIVFENQPIDRTLRHWDDCTLRFTDAADRGVTNFPMDLMVTLEAGGLEIEYMFLRSSFDEPGVERLRSHMEWLLEQLVADADRPLGQLGLVRPAERRWLDGLNARVPAAKDELPVHRL